MTLRKPVVVNAGSLQQLQAADILDIPAIRALSAGTQSASSGTIVLSNANGISFGMSGSSQITAKMPSVSIFEADKQAAMAANAVQANSGTLNLSLQRVVFPFQISATAIELLGHVSVAGSTANSYTLSAVIFSLTGSTASSISSGSTAITWNSGTNSTAASIYGAQSGTRWRSIPCGGTWNITPGEYLVGFMLSANGPANSTGSWTLYGGSSVSINQYPGGAAGQNYFADGIASAASSAFATSYHLTGVNQTGASALRQPFFRLIGSF